MIRRLREQFPKLHIVPAIADVRERKAIMDHLRYGTNGTDWEVIEHDVGRGDHLHLAYKVVERKRAWVSGG